MDIVYRMVPEDAQRAPSASAPSISSGPGGWRIVLSPLGQKTAPLGLEVCGDVVLGLGDKPDGGPDVSLSDWQGYRRGVSRRHLMLRPGHHKLFVMDLRSTNGTQINGLPLGVGWAYALQDSDVVTLGKLNVRVRIIQRP
jgi:hypothetical protein